MPFFPRSDFLSQLEAYFTFWVRFPKITNIRYLEMMQLDSSSSFLNTLLSTILLRVHTIPGE